jgi:hypothetical protein
MSNNLRAALIFGICLVPGLLVSTPIALADGPHSHGHNCATATDIKVNHDEQVVLDDTSDFAVYRIVLDRRGLIDIWTDPGSFDIWGMDLLDAFCEPVPRVSGGISAITGRYSKITVPTFKITPAADVFTLDPGVYYIRMHPDPSRVFHDVFTVHNKFTPHFGHDCATAEPIALPDAVNGALLYTKDREVFRITTDRPGRLHAWTVGAFAAADAPEVGLFFADCTSAVEQVFEDETGAGITSFLFKPGNYYVPVQPHGSDAPGTFILRLEFETRVVNPYF